MPNHEPIKITGWTLSTLQAQENDLLIVFLDKSKKPVRFVLKGPIGFEYHAPGKKALARYQVLDHGSYKEIRIFRSKEELALSCRFMEWETA